jgi:hypothetical protein
VAWNKFKEIHHGNEDCSGGMHFLRRLRTGVPDQVDHRKGQHLQDQQGNLQRVRRPGFAEVRGGLSGG